jgi:hypothetical protein
MATLIIIYPYKVTLFLWRLLELDDILKYADVEIWDISSITTPNFSKSIATESLRMGKVQVIDSVYGFMSNLGRIRLKAKRGILVCVVNEIPKNSFITLFLGFILYLYLKSAAIKVIELFNGGVPISYPEQPVARNREGLIYRIQFQLVRLIKSSNLREVGIKILAHFSLILSKALPDATTHRFVAGSSWHELAVKHTLKNVQIIFGHSHDYGHYLKSLTIEDTVTPAKNYYSAVLLDSPGPAFNGDSSLSKRRVFFTSEVWYPALCIFFDYVEAVTRTTVEIAGHYKSQHISPAPCFGNRKVEYGFTRQMVRESQFVITICSTAVSYAVLYRKPILFIYSNQLSYDGEVMDSINTMSKMLGTAPINIDNFPANFDDYLYVDEAKYKKYEQMVLTSEPLGRPNYQIILEDLMNIPVDKKNE